MANQQANEPGELIRALQDPALYGHPVIDFSVIETHISWILLTGENAYKIKKPVNLGFVDFSTLDRRKYFCEEELRLNRRFAEWLYLEVIAIRGSRTHPLLKGDGEVIEYAVRMREFSQSCLLSAHAAEHRLLSAHVDAMADTVSNFHEHAERADAMTAFGSRNTFLKWSNENFKHIEATLPHTLWPDGFEALKEECLALTPAEIHTIDQRRATGFIRECHGDLHLGNIALIEDKITPFDCIEFNEELRWIDTMNESAFLVMDLQARGYPAYAWRFLNRYLQAEGDYKGLMVLRHYLVYRALVRAKVEALRAAQNTASTTDEAAAYGDVTTYLDLAMSCSKKPRPALIIMHGFSGSGKSTLAEQLVENLGAIQVRSDVERKRLFGLQAHESSGSETGKGIYNEEASDATYKHLAGLARLITRAGYTAIVDASFLEFRHRAHFRQLAHQANLPHALISCNAAPDTLRARIRQRSESGRDASEATLEVLEHQLRTHDPLRAEERACTHDAPDHAAQPDAELLSMLERLITETR